MSRVEALGARRKDEVRSTQAAVKRLRRESVMSNPWKRISSVTLVFGLVIVAQAVPVWAAVPSNDTERGAVSIHAVPFTQTTDTTEATPGGPELCSNSASVFYRFTPAEDVRVQVDLLGSDYDTTLGVYSRDAQGRVEPLACNDDRVGDAAGVRLRAVADTTYYFMVGQCCRSGRSGGGQLVFTVTEVVTEPLHATFEVSDPGAVDPETGIATISGTVTCNKRSVIYMEGLLRQLREELFVARGYWWTYGQCTPDAPLGWSLEVDTDSGVAFGAGPATVRRWYMDAYAGWRDWFGESEDVTVTISLV